MIGHREYETGTHWPHEMRYSCLIIFFMLMVCIYLIFIMKFIHLFFFFTIHIHAVEQSHSCIRITVSQHKFTSTPAACGPHLSVVGWCSSAALNSYPLLVNLAYLSIFTHGQSIQISPQRIAKETFIQIH